MQKERIDILCVEQGLFDSREKAKRAIMAGIVRDANDYIDKPGTKIPVDTQLFVKGEVLPYVSRGGLKLEKAIKLFGLDLNDKIVLDIGSSTGGFTDCSLQNGAKRVYALDVGTNQLVWSLRNHDQVTVMEKTNFRHCTLDMFKEGQPEFATIDVSFISLKHILKPLKDILVQNGQFMALIKPQFEAGRDDVGKHGIVNDPSIHKRVIKEVVEYATENQMHLKELSYSPITGGSGNIEFIGLFENSIGESQCQKIDTVVEEAHSHFKG